MPWPLGKPRTGHVNRDGTPHKQRSFRISKSIDTPKPKTSKVVKPVVVASDKPKVIHGHSSRPAIETCPNCSYAYADGGYCPECGWSAPVVIGRVY